MYQGVTLFLMLRRHMIVGPQESLYVLIRSYTDVESLVFFVPLVTQRDNGVLMPKKDFCAHLEGWAEVLAGLVTSKYYSTS